MVPVFRFAPSPNGFLHLGHALSALLNQDLAGAVGGRLLLRIEDIDATRCRPEFEVAIFEDLAWLGLHWEEPVRRQSEHLPVYARALDALRGRGLVYPSFLSRAEIARRVTQKEALAPWPRDPDGAPRYPGHAREVPEDEIARRMAAGAPFAWRLDMAAALNAAPALSFDESGEGPRGEHGLVAAQPQLWGDVVLGRKDVPASYHLSVVIDDAQQGVSDVVRGQDLFHATGLHRLLQHLLGLPAPRYHHHRLVRDATGAKLSKSTKATGLRELREAGSSPADIRRMAGL